MDPLIGERETNGVSPLIAGSEHRAFGKRPLGTSGSTFHVQRYGQGPGASADPRRALQEVINHAHPTPLSSSNPAPANLSHRAELGPPISTERPPPRGEAGPTWAQRINLRERPAARCIGYQRWNQLLFAHWKVEPVAVQATLPRGLYVDRFAGAAYLGIVPFAMERVRPAWLPPLPWLSWFLELNVRTYVHDDLGRPGVWFYSLDCNRAPAVGIARRCFHLPYRHARMGASCRDGVTHYECARRDATAGAWRYAWTPGAESAPAAPGSLEFFLVERYLLVAADPAGRLYSGRVHHAPYRIAAPEVAEFSAGPARLAGFQLEGKPASMLAALPVDVSIFPLVPVQPPSE